MKDETAMNQPSLPSSNPQGATAWNDQAITLAQQGRFDEAVRGFEQAIRLQPGFAEAHNNLGNIFLFQRKFDQAVACYRQALQLNPASAEAFHNLGNVLKEQGQLDEAVANFQRALSLRPSYANARNSLGSALQQQGKLDAAQASYQQALRLQPDFAEAYNNMGAVLLEQSKLDAALASCQQALRLKPQFAEAYVSMGAVLAEQGKFTEAVASYRQALRLKPGLIEAHTNLGIALTQQGQLDEAATSLSTAVRLKPAHAEVHNALGTLFREQARMDAALASYQEAVRLRPAYAEARWNEGLTRLSLGDMERGWAGYQWYWRCKDFAGARRSYPQPEWDGSALTGRTILLYGNQGLGDTIQFIRFAPLVKESGGRVIVECQKMLAGLLAGCAGVDELVPAGSPLPAFDVHAPLMCLPAILGTTFSTLPANVPYLFADPQRVSGEWLVVSGEEGHYHSPLTTHHSPLLKIGIAWQGNPRYKKDSQRSIPLRHFAPLGRLAGVRLFSFQKGHGAEQLTQLGEHPPITDLGSRFDSFADTAAALVHMDLVITCDSVVAHLAGALGIPVWLALPFVPDWRWLLEREDSPWYPTMRLFRQTRPGDWEHVFQRIVEEVQRLYSHG